MRENKKEELFARTFTLLLNNNIGDLTLEEVEKATGFTRGAIFYYAKNKLDFFRQVIISQVLEKQDIHRKVNYTEGMSLKDFIQAYLEGIVHTRTYYMDSVSSSLPENPTHAYLLLILQIKRYYPDLGERYHTIMQDEIALWKKVLTDAAASGEITVQQDLDTVAATFQSIFYGYAFHASIGKAFDPTALKAQMMGYYQSLCSHN
ncbi:MAG: TetR/AcrR family transcriptional regulator [Bacteroidaceae bacterium]|nr:TetR/AcrR family transcriptional regulator [Bacteroidaceae bacterium]